ncbi:MAG: NUDIX hydrolase [Gammaproteobacteria bacterium]|jgi:8-oxo-dGTP pyrophosphatase MutT (NUDIX family)|nr:NUDIX hydrolase [Gammaproteobacteria bacterium]
MGESLWKPHTTVASICELDGRFLLVREVVDGCTVYNQPAGHLEPGETLLEAVVRETLEETRYRFRPLALQGIYRYRPSRESAKTYLRYLFRGEVGERLEGDLDRGIIAAEWLSYDEVVACRDQHRSPMVLQCIDDYRRIPGFSLDVLSREFA